MNDSKKQRSKADASDYEVGYGKPPRHSRFKRGQSGNPKGRPKGVRNFKTDLRATLDAPVKLTREGKPRKVSTQEAMLLRLREKALRGDGRSLDRLILLAQAYNDDELAASVDLSAEDAKVLRIYRRRVLSGTAAELDLNGNNDKRERDSTDQVPSATVLKGAQTRRAQVKRYRPSNEKSRADDADQRK